MMCPRGQSKVDGCKAVRVSGGKRGGYQFFSIFDGLSFMNELLLLLLLARVFNLNNNNKAVDPFSILNTGIDVVFTFDITFAYFSR